MLSLICALALRAGDWTSRPFGIVVALEDASLRGVLLDSTLIARSVDQGELAIAAVLLFVLMFCVCQVGQKGKAGCDATRLLATCLCREEGDV